MPNATTIYHAGQMVRVTGNTNHHGFAIGEIVELIRKTGDRVWDARNNNSPAYYLRECDFIPNMPYVPLAVAVELEDGQTACCECGSAFDTDDMIVEDGQSYCEDCHNDNFICCEECSCSHPVDDAVDADGSFYCSSRCANHAGYYICHDCDHWYHENDGGHNPEGMGVCESCAGEYCSCDECYETFHERDLRNGMCRECRSQDNGEVIKEYDYQPEEFLFAKMPWENTVYLGIELEVECGDKDTTQCAQKLMKWLEENKVNDRVYFKEDGSLRNGFEIVFMPATLQAIHKKFPMQKFLAYLRKIGLKSHEDNTCGLHVHISKTKITSRSLWAGKLFFYRCKDQILKFSAREHTRYCQFDQRMPENGFDQDHGRYSAFNTAATTNTVEVRIFRGTLAYDRFQASLQFSDLFAEYMQHIPVPFLKQASSTEIWADFLTYGKRKAKYQQFIKYCKAKGII